MTDNATGDKSTREAMDAGYAEGVAHTEARAIKRIDELKSLLKYALHSGEQLKHLAEDANAMARESEQHRIAAEKELANQERRGNAAINREIEAERDRDAERMRRQEQEALVACKEYSEDLLAKRAEAAEKERDEAYRNHAGLVESFRILQDIYDKARAALDNIASICRGLRRCRHGRSCCQENDNTVGAIVDMVRALDALSTQTAGEGK